MIAFSQSIISDFNSCFMVNQSGSGQFVCYLLFVSFRLCIYTIKKATYVGIVMLYYVISVIIMVHQYTLHRLSSYVVDSFMTDNWWAGRDI